MVAVEQLAEGAPSMGKPITDLSSVTTIGLDLAKHVFQIHGVDACGRAIVSKALQTRQAVDDYVSAVEKKPGEFMFTGRCGSGRSITTRQYARLVSEWIASIWPRSTSFRNPLLASDEGNPDAIAPISANCSFV